MDTPQSMFLVTMPTPHGRTICDAEPTRQAAEESLARHSHLPDHPADIREEPAQFYDAHFAVLCIERPRGFLPAHVLDAPEAVELWNSDPRVEFRSRSEALEYAAGFNRTAPADEWAIVLEIGEPPAGYRHFSSFRLSGEGGVEEAALTRPVRLVRFNPQSAKPLAKSALALAESAEKALDEALALARSADKALDEARAALDNAWRAAG